MTGNSLFYCSPGEAAAQTGDTLEHVRQRVLFCRGEPGRLPLYALFKTSCAVQWFVIPAKKDPAKKDPNYSGPSEGKAVLFLIPAKKDPNYSDPSEGKAVLFPGQYLEIDPEESGEVASSPEETFLVRWFRAPAEGLGTNNRIPGRALVVITNKAQIIRVNFSQCWIAERDLFGAECQPKAITDPIQKMTDVRHAPNRRAKNAAIARWLRKGAVEYDDNKSTFADDELKILEKSSPPIAVTKRTISEDWLSPKSILQYEQKQQQTPE